MYRYVLLGGMYADDAWAYDRLTEWLNQWRGLIGPHYLLNQQCNRSERQAMYVSVSVIKKCVAIL